MGWFSKKEEETSSEEIKETLVRAPPMQRKELPPLPRLPELPKEENSNEQFIKSSMSELSNLPKLKPLENKMTIELEPSKEDFEIHNITPPRKTINPLRKEIEPLFIKIDKFKEAIENFEKIKEKVQEIDTTLREIKDIKEKEDQELREWEHEIQMIKARIENIDNSLFKKIG